MAGFIDAWGRGILDILELMGKEELENPEFEESGDSFRIIFNRQVTSRLLQMSVKISAKNGSKYD